MLASIQLKQLMRCIYVGKYSAQAIDALYVSKYPAQAVKICFKKYEVHDILVLVFLRVRVVLTFSAGVLV